MGVSKCVLDRVEKRKNEFKCGLVEIMSRFACAHMEKSTNQYKDLDQLVDDVFAMFNQELKVTFMEGCAYECGSSLAQDGEYVRGSENEVESSQISTLESQASSSQQSLDERIPLVKFVAEELMDYDGTEEHFTKVPSVSSVFSNTNLDHLNSSSIQPDIKSNSTLERSKLTLNSPITLSVPSTSKQNLRGKKFKTHKDIIQHYSSSVNKEFKFPCEKCKKIRNRKDSLAFLMSHLRTDHDINLDQPNLHESNQLQNQPVSVSLDQFSANLGQSSHSLSQFNGKPKFINKPTNLRIISSNSPTQSKEEMDEDDQQKIDQLNRLEQIEGADAQEYQLAQNMPIGQVVVVPNKSPTYNHVCEHCGKGFQYPSNLKRHLQTHTGERPFYCTRRECDKSFTQNEHLLRHIKSHKKAARKRVKLVENGKKKM